MQDLIEYAQRDDCSGQLTSPPKSPAGLGKTDFELLPKIMLAWMRE